MHAMRLHGYFAVLVVPFLCCSPDGDRVSSSREVLKAVESPGRARVARLTWEHTGGGATGNTVSSIFLAGQLSESPERVGDPVFEGLGSCSIELEWRSDTLLLVRYDGNLCNIRSFKNSWYDPELVANQQRYERVEIALERR